MQKRNSSMTWYVFELLSADPSRIQSSFRTIIGRRNLTRYGKANHPSLLPILMQYRTSFQKERNLFIQQLQGISRMKRVRISFLSGDVHCAAVGVLKTLARSSGGKNAKPIEIPPATDYRYMINVVTSAIVNTPCVESYHM
jgi:hypothetical protein